MKIHIVQKGDTMWELSKKYGVDFEALKAANSHISSPDMIMPGMKIRIPTNAKTVKKEAPVKEVKEVKKEVKKEKQVETPFKDISPKPLPVIKEDDEKPEMVVKPELPMPQMPQIPQMTMPLMQAPKIEQEKHTTYNMTFNIDESSESKESSEKEVHHAKPKQQPISYQPISQPMHQPLQMIPCYPINPCWGMHPVVPIHPVPLPAHMVYPQQMPMVEDVTGDCGCGAPKIPPMGDVSPFDPAMYQGQPMMPQFDPNMMQGQGQPMMPQFDPNMMQGQGQPMMPQFDPNMMQGQGQPMMPQFDPNMMQGQGQPMMPQFDPNMMQGQDQSMMPQFDSNVMQGQGQPMMPQFDTSMFQGQANMPQMEPNTTYPFMSGFPENGFPTPPGFGELRADNEEESAD
ncbi:SafA/ExsA family spore coat assembly protein [Ornithinibacillus massiliensis]|uniref:SafA/ExsA family spore coat assembly protein n=1 Tax=Ornithinibacillus massiliensis TaxID=1944633 RepID=A0ABS5MAX4_9BACI|nr:SafA/ExsA family spore coat assembly protein [Ornithinibacillus massiliensis]MBS3679461.1 SafA/ExsA family spore coat assembly protein [Ornithinibacillus massiliensis]